MAAEKRDGVWKPGKFLEKHPISSVFLLDEDRTVTKAYGLHHALATDALNIAHPATLVICRNSDGGGIVRYVYRGAQNSAWQERQFPPLEVLRASGGLEEVFSSGEAAVFRTRLEPLC